MEDYTADLSALDLIFIVGVTALLLSAVFLAGRLVGKRSSRDVDSEFGNDAAVLKTVVEHAHEGLVMQDIYGRIEWSNPAYTRITGFSAEEIRGRRPQEFILPPNNQLTAEDLNNFKFDLGKFSSGFKELIQNQRKNGELFWNQLTFAQVEGDTDDKTRMIILCQDVTREVERFAELEETRKRLKYQAEHDELTGLATRAKITAFLQERLSTGGGDARPVGVIHFDLDHFKDINDSHGHSAGDTVLRHVAGVLKSVVADKGVVARVGGDEFLAAISDPTGPDQMEQLGQQMLDDLTRPVTIERERLKVAGSVGLVLADTGKTSLAELINRADIALYAAKKSGRGRYSWYTDALGAAHRHKRMSMAQLDQDLESGNLTLLMQPQYDLQEKRVMGYEVSTHWLHPSEGLVDPAKMLSEQEDTKRIARIEQFGLKQGLAEVRRMREATGSSYSLTVDLTGASVGPPDFEEKLCQLCEDADFPLEGLIVQLTPQAIHFDEPGCLQHAIDKISKLGCRIALDNVGSVHGGVAQLIQVSAHVMKISPWLVRDLETDAKKRHLTQAVIELADKFGCQVMAVGVATEAQREILRDYGCRFIQGDLIAAPMSAREAEIHLQEFTTGNVLD
ncbi:EAL domain-containing protein [uncultured Roseibium sp.]|uniref:putative bifunctional diguanylate cyclase/phosphodiesterase n=1 Tax=uncultured Roseibium sp. TaxID=1936171 RepID=UPI00262EBE92|nr:EAL domain-containing protein [uncultured Roseibium sp.]